MSRPRLSLIISTYNRPDVLAKCFAGVDLQSTPPDEVLIADDGSKQPTRDLIETWAKTRPFPVKHVWHEDSGFRKTAILNRAVAAATGDYLVFTDGDCVPHRRYMEDHLAVAERGFWVQARRCFVEEKFVPQFELGRIPVLLWMVTGRITGAPKGVRLPFPIVKCDTAQRGIIGCNMAAWRDDVVAVNGFDEEYSGWGIGEDSDLGTRLYHLGRPRKFVYAHAIVFHLNHPMSPRDHVGASLARLDETIRSKRVRCARGIDQITAPSK
jgi:glycosyltransferase involved in cell wall biosynthesis